MRITLTVVEGPHQGQVFTFVGQESFVVGRSKQALFRLPKKDRYISRNHFVVEVNPPHCRLVDLKSRNGTFVNDEKVERADLLHQDIIRIGHTMLQVRLETLTDEEPAELPNLFGPFDLEEPQGLPLADDAPSPKPAATTSVEDEALQPLSASITQEVKGLASPPHDYVNAVTERELQLPPLVKTPATPEVPLSVPPEPAAAAPEPSGIRTTEDFAMDAFLVAGAGPDQARCPLCNQPWQPDADQPRLWCDICAKAAKLLPQICPGYLLVRELGRGTIGVVYQAVREEDQQIAAVRHLAPEETMGGKRRQRFLKEMEQLRTLRHPGIVPLLDHVEADGQLFLVLEVAEGENAAEALKRTGPFTQERAVTLLCQCLEALECAHALGILHREIKPNSILLDRHGGTEQARLMDFGLEWLCQIAHVSRYSLLKGQTETVTWMPPEQIYDIKNVTQASDIYALAATFYTLLTGQTLFTGEDKIESLLRQILEDDPTPLRLLRPDLPPPLAEVLHRALAKEPSARFANAAKFRTALEPFRRG